MTPQEKPITPEELTRAELHSRWGEGNHRAVLTWDVVRAIRADGGTSRGSRARLAREHGVNHRTISDILTGRSWTPGGPPRSKRHKEHRYKGERRCRGCSAPIPSTMHGCRRWHPECKRMHRNAVAREYQQSRPRKAYKHEWRLINRRESNVTPESEAKP